jgi:hypothetical protein
MLLEYTIYIVKCSNLSSSASSTRDPWRVLLRSYSVSSITVVPGFEESLESPPKALETTFLHFAYMV